MVVHLCCSFSRNWQERVQVTVDMKLGMFEEHKTPDDPLAVSRRCHS